MVWNIGKTHFAPMSEAVCEGLGLLACLSSSWLLHSGAIFVEWIDSANWLIGNRKPNDIDFQTWLLSEHDICKASGPCWGSPALLGVPSFVVWRDSRFFPQFQDEEIEGYGNVGTNLLAFAKTVMKELPCSILLVTAGLRSRHSIKPSDRNWVFRLGPEKIRSHRFEGCFLDKNHQLKNCSNGKYHFHQIPSI